MRPGVLITGTDAGVGKTFVGAAMALALRRRGFSVGALKAVESGCLYRNGRLLAPDALYWKKKLELPEPVEAICPYRFRTPLAPAVAARLEGVRIDPEVIARCFGRLADRYDVVFVEGAGGLLAPLTEDFFVLDLASRLSLPVLVVVGSRLGAINHTLLTLECLKTRGLPLVGMAINLIGDHQDPATEGNAETITNLTDAPLLGILPKFDVDESIETVSAWIEEWFDIERIVARITRT